MTNRLNLESNYYEALKRRTNISAGSKFVSHISKQILLPVATDITKNRLKKYVNEKLNEIEKNNKKGK